MVPPKLTKEVKNRSILAFTKAIDKAYNNWGFLIARSFVSGIFIGLGATVGFAIVIALLGYVFGVLELLPVIGEFFTRMNEFLNSTISAAQF
jgi:hypothetical protein